MNEPNILIGCPLMRNREWIIEEYLSGIYALDYPKDKIHIAFLLNGEAEDNTEEYVWEFKHKFEDRYKAIDIWSMSDSRVDYRKDRDFEWFGNIRNTWITMRRKYDDYVFSVDSDIILPEGALKKLLSHKKKIVSALIENGDLGPYKVYNIFDFAFTVNENGQVRELYSPVTKSNGLIQVDVTGACYLIHKDVLNKGAHYGYHPQGEDVYFCKQARKLGYKIYCDQDLTPEHIMTKERGRALHRIKRSKLKMNKEWLCSDCYNKWKADEKITICCPVCGSKAFYNIGKIKMEL